MSKAIEQILEDMSSQLNYIYQHIRSVDEQLDAIRIGLSRDKARVNADIVNISNKLTQISQNLEHIAKVTSLPSLKRIAKLHGDVL